MRMVKTIDLYGAMRALGLSVAPHMVEESVKTIKEYEALGMPFRSRCATYVLEEVVAWHAKHMARELAKAKKELEELKEEDGEKC